MYKPPQAEKAVSESNAAAKAIIFIVDFFIWISSRYEFFDYIIPLSLMIVNSRNFLTDIPRQIMFFNKLRAV